ncbi:MAG: hypothetical protein JWM68_2285 [Verrucomicrobiales bacterium]|nr:hypothetical protein [Verrucomicrobiales bacterium]
MKNTFLLLSLAAVLVGCTSYYPPRTSMYSDYGFTYDYRESPVPSVDVPATTVDTTPAPTFLVQVPPPTVIYQTTQAPVLQSSVDTNAVVAVDPNPYRGTYAIPPKVVVVPQQTIIREGAGAAPGSSVTAAPPTPPATPQFYPGTSYIYPGTVGTTTIITNGTNNGGITNTNASISITNQNTASVTNTINEGAGAQRTNPPPFTRVPGPTNVLTPPPGTQPTSALQRPRNTQSTSGSGTGQPAGTTTGGSFAPPPPGATPLPGTEPKTP